MCLNAWFQLAALFAEVVNIAETGQGGGGRALRAVSISAVSPSSLLPDLLGYEKPLPPPLPVVTLSPPEHTVAWSWEPR